MLISQPGSDYQLTQITLDAGHARDITCLLLDIHAVLDSSTSTEPGPRSPAPPTPSCASQAAPTPCPDSSAASTR
jgi:hypothetical protein